MNQKQLLAVVLATAFIAPAFAQNTDTPKIDQRQENQQQRIDKGVQSGALTAKEAEKLEKRQDKIEAREQAAKADGKVTRAERRRLKNEQDQASRGIYKKKHNHKSASAQ